MQERIDRKTGRKISLLGFGAMRFPKLSGDQQGIDTAQAEKLIDYAYSHGVNYFDTAYVYHEGKSENCLGEILKKYQRESFCLADKMPSWELKSHEDGIRIFEDQLKKCQVDYFDFYLCHSLGSSLESFISQYEETGILDYLRGRMEAGQIRRLGFSFHGSPDVLEKIVDRHKWDFVQIQLNYLDWDMQNAKRQYEILEKRGIPCIVMEPVRGGALCSLCEEAVDLLKAEEPEKSLASWAIRFAASQPNVLTVLSGMSAMEQVVDNVNTITDFHPMSDHEKEVLGKAVEAYLRKGTIPCTGCRYCMDCPAGVDIPGVFAVYNKCASNSQLPMSFGKQGNAKAFLEAYHTLPESARAANCVACRKCVQHCPQKIEIPERMKEIAELASSC